MKNEIKEIIGELENIRDNFADGVLVDLMNKAIDCITNLQEENMEYKRLMCNIDMNSVDYVYNKDTKLYTFDRKNWYKINKKLDERFNYKLRIDKAIEILHQLNETLPTDLVYSEIAHAEYVLQGSDKVE